MNIRYLKIFQAVCDYGSTVKASQKLFIAQPSISVAIAEMEKHYNVVLFNKIKQRLVLTDEGKKLLILAKIVIEDFNQFENTAHSLLDLKQINLGCSISIGTFMLPQLLKNLNDSLPKLKIKCNINQSQKIANQVIDGNLDFALIESPIKNSNLTSINFKQDKLVVIASRKFDEDVLKLENISKYNFILREKGSSSRQVFDDNLIKHNKTITPIIESVSSTAIIKLVENNIGISILPHLLCKQQLENKTIKQIKIADIEFNKDYYLIYHANRKLNTIDNQLIDLFLSIKSNI